MWGREGFLHFQLDLFSGVFSLVFEMVQDYCGGCIYILFRVLEQQVCFLALRSEKNAFYS